MARRLTHLLARHDSPEAIDRRVVEPGMQADRCFP